MTTLAFFGSKGGVGKTTLVYHLAWMFAEHGVRTLAVDLDPQASLSALFLDDDRLEELWVDSRSKSKGSTVFDCVRPLMDGTGDVIAPHVEQISDELHLIAGNIALSTFEDLLSESWSKCLAAQEPAFGVTLSFDRVISKAATQVGPDLVLIDLGPGFSAINRSALLAAQGVAMPVIPDLSSIMSLRSTGTTLERWFNQWQERTVIASTMTNRPGTPRSSFRPEGYIVVQPTASSRHSPAAYLRSLSEIPSAYREYILHDASASDSPIPESDPNRLGSIKYHLSLMMLALKARKPMFSLKPADGAIGSHVEAVQACYRNFYELASTIAAKNGIDLK